MGGCGSEKRTPKQVSFLCIFLVFESDILDGFIKTIERLSDRVFLMRVRLLLGLEFTHYGMRKSMRSGFKFETKWMKLTDW